MGGRLRSGDGGGSSTGGSCSEGGSLTGGRLGRGSLMGVFFCLFIVKACSQQARLSQHFSKVADLSIRWVELSAKGVLHKEKQIA